MNNTMRLKTVLHIGMNDKDTHKQEHSIEFFHNRITYVFPVCTIVEAVGYWNGEKENSLVVTIYDETSNLNECKKQLIDKVDWLKGALNQDCILVTVEQLNYEVI